MIPDGPRRLMKERVRVGEGGRESDEGETLIDVLGAARKVAGMAAERVEPSRSRRERGESWEKKP